MEKSWKVSEQYIHENIFITLSESNEDGLKVVSIRHIESKPSNSVRFADRKRLKEFILSIQKLNKQQIETILHLLPENNNTETENVKYKKL